MQTVAILLLSLLFTIPCLAQGGVELEALAEGFFAKDVKTMLRHLPPELGEALAKASPQNQRMLVERLMFRQQAEKEGVKFTRPEGGGVLLIEPPARGEGEQSQQIEVFLDKRMTDGNETMLRFRIKSTHDVDLSRQEKPSLWMRYVDREWRIYEIDLNGESIKLDDPSFLTSLTEPESGRPAANEASAVGSLRTLNMAMVTYASTYPEIGFASSIAVLSGDGTGQDQAGLIDPTLGTPPFEKNGYRFALSTPGGWPNVEYSFTARPIEFGVTGSRNFFTDQSGVIRFTNEDREATANDSPLQ
jgi:hypothetical protein